MDTDEKLYFIDFEKKSFSDIQQLFSNLKHIGMTDEEINKYAMEYKLFFEKRAKAENELKKGS